MVDVDLETENNFYTGITGDVSEGGVFLASDGVMRMGSQVEFDLRLPQRSFHVRGEVRWIVERDDARAGYGLKFVDIPEDALWAIREFVLERQSFLYDVPEPQEKAATLETPAAEAPREKKVKRTATKVVQAKVVQAKGFPKADPCCACHCHE